MKTTKIIRVLIGTAILTLLFGFLNTLVGIPIQSNYYFLSLIANLLINIVFLIIIRNACLKNKQLVLFVFFVYFIIGQFNILIEAYLFDVSNRTVTIKELIKGFGAAALFSPIAVFLYKKPNTTALLKFNPRKKLNWIWKIILGNFLYLLLYIIAGMILVSLYPKLLDFYSDKIPPFDLMIKTQLFIRGPVFILVAILILKYINLSLLKKSLLIGLTFSILGGIAPLIPTNELMPGFVRFGHLFEVGISNFVFGILLGYLLGQKRIINN